MVVAKIEGQCQVHLYKHKYLWMSALYYYKNIKKNCIILGVMLFFGMLVVKIQI